MSLIAQSINRVPWPLDKFHFINSQIRISAKHFHSSLSCKISIKECLLDRRKLWKYLNIQSLVKMQMKWKNFVDENLQSLIMHMWIYRNMKNFSLLVTPSRSFFFFLKNDTKTAFFVLLLFVERARWNIIVT